MSTPLALAEAFSARVPDAARKTERQPVSVRAMAEAMQQRLTGAGGSCAVFPVSGKRPLIKWGNVIHAPGVYGDEKRWARATGYAVAPVHGSRLAVLDIDDSRWLVQNHAALPSALTDASTRRTYTRRGVHVYVILAEPLGVARGRILQNGQEAASLRSAGAYVIGPGSLHPDGGEYRAAGERVPVLSAADTARLVGTFQKARENAPASGESGVGDVWVNPALVDAVVSALEAKVGELKFSAKGTAPFRAWWRRDRNPSAFFSRITGNVFDSALSDEKPDAEGKVSSKAKLMYTLKQLCAEFGIEPRDYGGLSAARAGTCGNTANAGNAESPTDVSSVSKPGIALYSRARLIESGLTITARLLDLVRDLVGGTFTRAIVIEGLSQLSAKAVDRALEQAVEHGYMERVEHGWYRISDAGAAYCSANASLDDESAYTGHPAAYRRAAYAEALATARPADPTTQPSTAALAALAGISRATAYRYESALGITRHGVIVHTDAPALDNHAAWAALAGEPGWHIDMINRKTGQTVRHMNAAHDADGLYELRREIAYLGWRWRAYPVLARRLPSVRVLPGEDVGAFLTGGARLEGNGFIVADRHSGPPAGPTARPTAQAVAA